MRAVSCVRAALIVITNYLATNTGACKHWTVDTDCDGYVVHGTAKNLTVRKRHRVCSQANIQHQLDDLRTSARNSLLTIKLIPTIMVEFRKVYRLSKGQWDTSFQHSCSRQQQQCLPGSGGEQT